MTSQIKPSQNSDAKKKKEQEKKVQDKKKIEAEKKRLAELESRKKRDKASTDKVKTDKAKTGQSANANKEKKSDSARSLDKKPNRESEEKRLAQQRAEHEAVKPYDLASGPPDLSQNIKKIIPSEPIKINDLKPREGIPVTKIEMPDEIIEVPIHKPKHTKADHRQLTPEQKKIRDTVAQPADGVGCAFNKRQTTDEMDRYMGERSKTDLWRLAYSNSEIVVTAFCSSPGSKNYNRELAKERADTMVNHMVEKYGIKKERFTIKLVGDELSDKMSPGEDRPMDRVVMVDITGHEKSPVIGPDRMDIHAIHGIGDLPDNHPDKNRLQIGDHPKDRSFIVGDDRIGLHNNETGKSVLIRTKDIPEGHSKINNTWVYRREKHLETRAFLPTTPETVKNELIEQKRAMQSRSLFPVTEVTAGEVLNRLSLNMKLNNEIESNLTPDQSLSTAMQKSRQAGLKRLRQSIADVVTDNYMEKFILGTISKHNF